VFERCCKTYIYTMCVYVCGLCVPCVRGVCVCVVCSIYIVCLNVCRERERERERGRGRERYITMCVFVCVCVCVLHVTYTVL
jgi:hypothetical protein